jgi:single-strand DNA-binding protein
MAGVNKVILVGNLGKDPEIRTLENGRSVASFSLATSETYKNKAGEKVTNTEWHNVVLWSPLAEIADKFLKKGNQVYIEGKITNRTYNDKDGNKKYITEIVGQNMTLIGGRPDFINQETSGKQENSQYEEPEGGTFTNSEPGGEDDLPF